MLTELKPNICIEGFDKVSGEYNEKLGKYSYYDKDKVVMYYGKTSEIPINLAKNIFDYGYDSLETHLTTLDEAISEACNQTYCIIYKKIYDIK